MEDFLVYHSEWNLGSPGGWEYQRITQELGKLAWRLLRPHLDSDIRLDFDHEYFNPVPAFAAALLRAHRQRNGDKAAHIVRYGLSGKPQRACKRYLINRVRM